ncbi:MAG: hypothetical protein H7Y22_01900 [Gemmatimonadaceae bacterium]|nr:hypothetical protein [Gloeobacterales cyanobacterium ES-bin-141]
MDTSVAHLGAVAVCAGLAVAARTQGQSLVPDRTSISPTTPGELGSGAGAGDQLLAGGEPWV